MFSMVFLMLRIIFNVFLVMFAKTSVLFCWLRIVLSETSMLLFMSILCYAKPRCYYSYPYGVMRNLDAIIRVRMVLCKTSMLLFVSVWCYAKPRCYYSCPYGDMRNLDAVIRVRIVLCETSVLLFVSVWCYAKPRCYYSYSYGVIRNLDAIIRVSNYVRLNPGLERARPIWSGASDKSIIMPILPAE